MTARQCGQVVERADHDALLGARAVFDQCAGRGCGASVREQARAHALQPRDAHVERKRLLFARETGPVQAVVFGFRMGGHEAHRLRVIAMGQRNAGVSRAGQRGGDAGHHFVADAVRAQEFEFFAAAAEDETVAALQPHDAFAGARVFQHQCVDLFLRHVVMAGFLAHFDAFGIAARKFQHLGADQAVVQDHIGLVEQAQPAQGEQTRVAGAGADQRHAAFRLHVGIARGHRQQRALGGIGFPAAQQALDIAAQYGVEKTPPRGGVGHLRTDPAAVLDQQVAQRAQRFIEFGFQTFAQMARQHRRAAAAGDSDLQRPALDPCRHLEAAQRGIVDHVRPDPARLRGFSDAAVGVGLVGGGDHQPDAVEPGRIEAAVEMRNLAGCGPFGDFRVEIRRADPDLGPGRQQRGDLASGHRTPADHQHRPVAEVEKGGEERGRGCRAGVGHGLPTVERMSLHRNSGTQGQEMTGALGYISIWHKNR